MSEHALVVLGAAIALMSTLFGPRDYHPIGGTMVSTAQLARLLPPRPRLQLGPHEPRWQGSLQSLRRGISQDGDAGTGTGDCLARGILFGGAAGGGIYLIAAASDTDDFTNEEGLEAALPVGAVVMVATYWLCLT